MEPISVQGRIWNNWSNWCKACPQYYITAYPTNYKTIIE